MDLPSHQALHLVLGGPDRRGGGDDLRAPADLLDDAENRGIIDCDRRAERTRQEMHLVLEDQGGWLVAACSGSQQHPGFLHEGQACELVDRCQQDGGRVLVDPLVDDLDGKLLVESTCGVRAP